MIKDDFKRFCSNIALENYSEMKVTIKEIAKKLNKEYYDIENDELHMNVVGSVGRETAIKNTSDLDLLFELPKDIYTKYDNYESNGQSALLQDVKEVLKDRYPNTKIKGDGQVVVISFSKYKVELVPGFKQSDGRFKYPDSNDGGHWKYTDPLPEIAECKRVNTESDGNFLNICHMLRAWKNKCNFKFKGLLIDTLANNFLKDNEKYKVADYKDYLDLLKDLFLFLKKENEEQEYWLALGSNQHITNDDNGKFVKKAKKAYNKLKDTKEDDENINEILRNIFGREFPKNENQKNDSIYRTFSYRDTEEFIENLFPVDVIYNMELDCNITQNGWRSSTKLRRLLEENGILKPDANLEFYIKNINQFEKLKPYDIYWKVKNEGEIAMKKDMIRGQIRKTNLSCHNEHTNFRGNHYVEVYIVKDEICIAKERIDVPIRT